MDGHSKLPAQKRTYFILAWALRSFLNPTVKRNKVEIANGNFINKWKKPLTELKKKRKAI